jgi:hypothetical protein
MRRWLARTSVHRVQLIEHLVPIAQVQLTVRLPLMRRRRLDRETISNRLTTPGRWHVPC